MLLNKNRKFKASTKSWISFEKKKFINSFNLNKKLG